MYMQLARIRPAVFIYRVMELTRTTFTRHEQTHMQVSIPTAGFTRRNLVSNQSQALQAPCEGKYAMSSFDGRGRRFLTSAPSTCSIESTSESIDLEPAPDSAANMISPVPLAGDLELLDEVSEDFGFALDNMNDPKKPSNTGLIAVHQLTRIFKSINKLPPPGAALPFGSGSVP